MSVSACRVPVPGGTVEVSDKYIRTIQVFLRTTGHSFKNGKEVADFVSGKLPPGINQNWRKGIPSGSAERVLA